MKTYLIEGNMKTYLIVTTEIVERHYHIPAETPEAALEKWKDDPAADVADEVIHDCTMDAGPVEIIMADREGKS